MRKPILSFAAVALSAASTLAAAPQSLREPQPLRVRATHEDPASVSGFVSALRTEAEGASERVVQPPRSFQEALSRILPEFDGALRCLTPIVLEVSRQGPSSPALGSYTSVALAPPILSREAILTSPDGSFAIHYTLDRASGDAVLFVDHDANGVPDYVDLVSASLVSARDLISARTGIRPLSTRAPLDVYLANLGGRIDGYTAPLASGELSFVALDSRLLGNDALLRAAVAHQYAHAALSAYSSSAPPWWGESSAAWLEGVVVGSYAHYTDKMQEAVEAASVGLGSDDARLCQGHLLWPLYLASRGGREALVRGIWENLEQQGDAADLWRATDDALRGAGSSIEAAFSDYSLWLLLSGQRNDGRHFAVADRLDGVSFAGRYEAYPAAQIQAAPQIAPLGAAFIRFVADSSDGGLRLRFEGDLPGSFQAQILLTPRKEGAPFVRAPVLIDSRGRGSIGIPWASFSEAVLVVGNVARGGGEASYSFVARSEQNFPFELVALRAEPSEDEVLLTWETQSENGLYGWIVYRTERPSGSVRRINQFIVPAIGDGDGPVSYQYVDGGVMRGRSYLYKLVGVTQDGLTREVPETRVNLPR